MAKRVSADRWLFTVTLCLVFVGLVMVFSASAVIAKERYGSGYTFLFRQLAWAVTGIVAMFVAMKLDYRRYKHPAVVFSVLGVTTLMLISVFFLDRTHHTHRWIHWGSFSFQPSEIAKPALILFLAFFLECRTRSIDDWRDTLLPAIIPTAAFLGLIIFQPDLGTAVACAALFFDLPCRVPARPHSGIPRSLLGSAGTWISHYSITHRRQHWRHYRPGIDGGEAEAVLSSRTAH